MKTLFLNKGQFSDSPALPWILLIICSAIWGASFILIKRGLDAFSPLQVGALRITLAAAALLPIALKNLHLFKKREGKILIVVGFLSNLIPAILFAVAETRLASSITGILNSLTPMFTLAVGFLFFAVPLAARQTSGLAVGLAGSILISLMNSEGAVGQINYYVLFVVVATFCYGLSVNIIKRHLGGLSSKVITSVGLFSALPVALIILASTGFLETMQTEPLAWASFWYVAILGVAGTAVALIMFNKIIQMTNAVFASSVTYLIPIFAVFLGLLDGEALYSFHYAGMLLIIIGVYLANTRRKRDIKPVAG